MFVEQRCSVNCHYSRAGAVCATGTAWSEQVGENRPWQSTIIASPFSNTKLLPFYSMFGHSAEIACSLLFYCLFIWEHNIHTFVLTVDVVSLNVWMFSE